MSSSTPGQTSAPSSDFKSILDEALRKYEEKTGKPLLDDPLANTELKQCESVDAIKAIFQAQAEAFQSKEREKSLMKWIGPTVDVLCTLSDTLGGVAGIAFPPAGAILTGIGVLLTAAKNVKASHDALVDLFERIESFFKRLGVYTQVSLTTEMTEVFVKIVSEVLSILSIATKEVKRKRTIIYFKKLLGRKDIEDALARLENLIQEEVRMAIAQTTKDVKIAHVKIDRITWNQIEQNVRTWFSPPDPSTNHNTACRVYHNVLPTWFFEAAVFKRWMSKGSLLWVHGKPGSGKSVMCAAIIQHIMELRDAGRATLAYFYFDFQDEEKQNVANALTSLLIQLSAYSDPCCDIVHRLYLTHGRGTQRPSNDILIDCLEKMLAVVTQHPIFIVMDALDECPDVGLPTPREAVLNLLKDLVRLDLPNLHVCVTSRPEVDIQTMLKPLAVNVISLHEDTGQKSVIANYVTAVVSSDMRFARWLDEDKELVVEELSKRADGMFQWVYCQLMMLRHAVQPDVRAILEELPETLDGTYERVLKNINATNRAHASRLLHCLAVAVRPLRVEELAEILTFDFDAAQGGIPKFRPNRRRQDQEESVLSICSSLITVVDKGGSRVVQFSHLSVKEFLTSNHLATSTGNLSTYQILPGPAHTILAQACLGLLLHLDDRKDNKSVKESPLAEYAARHWIAHAQFEGVASRVEDGVKSFYDLGKPHVATWIGLYNHYSGSKKANNVDEITWNKIEQNVRKWFSPPDPSTNHNTACDVYDNPPTWLFEAGVFKDWMSNGSLLWVHGKPGSGKSVLCSAIIQHIMKLRDAGRATLAYFYFDFGDEEKKNVRNAVTSLLIQLSAYSKPCCDIIYRLYSAHGKGTEQPSYGILIDRLKEMVTVTAQYPIFLVIDALDECPTYSGLPTPREKLLNLVEVLVSLHLPNLRICVTSRPEVDIQVALEPLTTHHISLHDQSGHKMDISEYVTSVVWSHEYYMRQWRDGDKKLVVDVLSERADGMFQWVYCQLVTLRHVGQAHVRAVLERLPETLDETYARLLSNINEDNRAHARRLLHCLAVAVRPLRVEELAEILAFDFDAAHGGISTFHKDWRPEDPEEAVTSICSSLITIVNNRGSRVVKFSHMSVKEFLTSDRLANSTVDLRTYHILSGPAHTILAQACLGLLLHLDDGFNYESARYRYPLVGYAARHWVAHAQFWDVASCLTDGMKFLFDLDRPHFAAWTRIYDMDADSDGKFPSEKASPLYYSALCGFFDLAEHLLMMHPEQLKDVGGSFGSPLVAAICRNHLRVVELLFQHGSDMNVEVWDARNQTALHKAIDRHNEVSTNAVRFLLEHGADVNAQRDDLWTPLHLAVNFEELRVARILLDFGADVNSRNGDGQAPLHLLSRRETSQGEDDGSDIARLLLDKGANVDEKDKDNATPLHLACHNQKLKIVRVLLDHDANADAEKDGGETPLQLALTRRGHYDAQGVGVARLLLEHGAEAYGRDTYHISTSDLACCFGKEKIGQVLLVDGGKFKPENNRDQTAFWLWIEECSVGGKVQDKYDTILLHSASYHGRPEMVRTLLENGVKSNAKNHRGETALHVVSRARDDSQNSARVGQLSVERGVGGSTQDVDHDSEEAGVDVARLLLKHGTDVNAKTWSGETPLDLVSDRRPKLAQLLREHRAKAKKSSSSRTGLIKRK